MGERIKIFFEVFISVSPILVVSFVFGYIVRMQEKRATEREEEQRKGIYRSHYTVKSEKMLVIIFVAGLLICGGCTIWSAMEGEKVGVVFFGLFGIIGVAGVLNMSIWKLEINGDEILWRSTFGKKRKFTFDDIMYIEYRRQSKRLCIDGEEPFTITIDNNIDDAELMEDIKRRRLPVHSLKLRDNWLKKKNKKRR